MSIHVSYANQLEVISTWYSVHCCPHMQRAVTPTVTAAMIANCCVISRNSILLGGTVVNPGHPFIELLVGFLACPYKAHMDMKNPCLDVFK